MSSFDSSASAGETQVFENFASFFFVTKVQLPEINKNKRFSYKKLDAPFSKPVFHVENHSGGAVKT